MNYKKRILVVDDEENVSQLLKKVLSKEGYNVVTFTNPLESLKFLEENLTDIIISDIKMPEMNGLDLLKKVKEIDNSIKMLLITAFATIETAVEALRLGACDYITKPFNLEEVVQAVNKISCSIDRNELDADPFLLNIPALNILKSKSPKMLKIIQLIQQIADTKSSVLIFGETGTGKELIGQALHHLSARKDKAFIKFNCAAIPETLLESELFGFEKGAFTGATHKKPGRFELADGGSLFIDEIGDIPQSVQVKLLRTIQEKEFERLGGILTIKTDVRLITATNRDLDKLVEDGLFREDLFYRLNVISIQLPSLRERKEDIIDLCNYFLQKSALISSKPLKSISKEVTDFFMKYRWPGNIRELENVIERCVVVNQKDMINLDDLPERMLKHSKFSNNDQILDNAIDNLEHNIIKKSLEENNGNKTLTAEKLGISRRSLHRKINKYLID